MVSIQGLLVCLLLINDTGSVLELLAMCFPKPRRERPGRVQRLEWRVGGNGWIRLPPVQRLLQRRADVRSALFCRIGNPSRSR